LYNRINFTVAFANLSLTYFSLVINASIHMARAEVQRTTVGSGTSYVGPFTQTTYCNRDYPHLCWQHERESVSTL